MRVRVLSTTAKVLLALLQTNKTTGMHKLARAAGMSHRDTGVALLELTRGGLIIRYGQPGSYRYKLALPGRRVAEEAKGEVLAAAKRLGEPQGFEGAA